VVSSLLPEDLRKALRVCLLRTPGDKRVQMVSMKQYATISTSYPEARNLERPERDGISRANRAHAFSWDSRSAKAQPSAKKNGRPKADVSRILNS
jgi:hypothetical protein